MQYKQPGTFYFADGFDAFGKTFDDVEYFLHNCQLQQLFSECPKECQCTCAGDCQIKQQRAFATKAFAQVDVFINKSINGIKIQQQRQRGQHQNADHIYRAVHYDRPHYFFNRNFFIASHRAGAHDFAHARQTEIGKITDDDGQKSIHKSRCVAQGAQQHIPADRPADVADQIGYKHHADPEIIDALEVVPDFLEQAAFFRRDAFHGTIFLKSSVLAAVNQI